MPESKLKQKAKLTLRESIVVILDETGLNKTLEHRTMKTTLYFNEVCSFALRSCICWTSNLYTTCPCLYQTRLKLQQKIL